MITAKTNVELPKFRYIEDVLRYLKELRDGILDNDQVIQQQQKLLAFLNRPTQRLSAALVFDVTPTDSKTQRKKVRNMKTEVDPELKEIVVPNLKKLKEQYSLAEDLYDKHRTLEAMETQLNLQFPDRRGDSFGKAIGAITELKAKVEKQLKQVFTFLNEVAEKHVPKTFKDYMQAIVALVDDQVVFKSSQTFLYVNVSDNKEIVFSYYLMLEGAINDEGQVAPHLYISVQWVVGGSVLVQLNHEYAVPNELLRDGGTKVSNAGSAAKAISELLAMEQFSTTLGVVPMALQLRVDPQKIDTKMFSYRDLIKSIAVDEDSLTFILRKEADSDEVLKNVSYQLYMEIKALIKTRGAKLQMKYVKDGKRNAVKFQINKLAKGEEFSSLDAEFLRDRFGLNNSQLRKIVTILNTEHV